MIAATAFFAGGCQPTAGDAAIKSLGFAQIEAALEEGVALVDIEEIFNSYYRRDAAQAQVDTVATELNGRLQTARGALARLLKQIETARLGLEDLPPTDRADREQQIVAQIRQAQELNQRIEATALEYQRAIAAQSAQISAGIYEEIEGHISRVAQREGYRMVINKGAKDNNGLPIFPYVFDRRDLTGEIITAMNASRPPDVAVPAGEAQTAVLEVLDQVDDLSNLIPEGMETSGTLEAESPADPTN